jgi:hypothetical protein
MENDFRPIFQSLSAILRPYAERMTVAKDTLEVFSLNMRLPQPGGQPLFFAAAYLKTGDVSFYLMPVYCYPDLLDTISPALRAQHRGKSRFAFVRPDPELFQELRRLTAAAADRFARAGYG